jgi:hypothetical protein
VQFAPAEAGHGELPRHNMIRKIDLVAAQAAFVAEQLAVASKPIM